MIITNMYEIASVNEFEFTFIEERESSGLTYYGWQKTDDSNRTHDLD